MALSAAPDLARLTNGVVFHIDAKRMITKDVLKFLKY